MAAIQLSPAPFWLVEQIRANPGGSSRPSPVLANGELITEGSRNSSLTSLAGSMRRRGMSQESIEAALLVENGQRCDPPLDDEEVRKIAQSVARYDPSDPLLIDSLLIDGWSEEYRKAVEDECTIVWASAIEPVPVEWLWPNRIPLGKLTTFAGLGGIGKSFVLLDMTARITRGAAWPFSAGQCAPAGKVLFVSGEDDPADTLVPRLIEMGGDRSRVAFLKTDVINGFHLSHVKTLEKAYQDCGGGVTFVAIDPPTAFLGGVDDHKNSQLRTVLSPLARWAAERRLAIVFNTHFNKGGQDVEAVMRVMGSVAWVNAVRAAHAFTRDPDDKKRVFCLPMKSNLGPLCKGLSYRIVPSGVFGSAKVEWIEEVEVEADDVVGKKARKPREVAARDVLLEMFRRKREWQGDDFWGELKMNGVHRDAVFAAREGLRIPRARRVTSPGGDVRWVWWVPEDWPFFSENPATVATE